MYTNGPTGLSILGMVYIERISFHRNHAIFKLQLKNNPGHNIVSDRVSDQSMYCTPGQTFPLFTIKSKLSQGIISCLIG